MADQLEALEPELDLQGLPTQFHVLIPLIKKCGIADDFDRDEFLSNLPRQSLQQLTEIVTPFLRTIDSYLDSFDETPPNEQAIALGRLAECALEAKQLLKQSKE